MTKTFTNPDDYLFAKWSQNPGDQVLVKDGILNLDEWQGVVFLLKEANGVVNDEHDLRKFVMDTRRWQTWNNIARWTYGILSREKSEWPEADNALNNRKYWLSKIAIINVKKFSGTSSTNPKKLLEWFEKNNGRKILAEQLSRYGHISYIICCGYPTFKCLQLALEDDCLKRKWKNYTMPKIIDFYHPQARRNNEEMYKELMSKVYGDALLQIDGDMTSIQIADTDDMECSRT